MKIPWLTLVHCGIGGLKMQERGRNYVNWKKIVIVWKGKKSLQDRYSHKQLQIYRDALKSCKM